MPKDSSRVGNPLFLEWVQDMHVEKDYKKKGGPPRATGYEKAIQSLENCSQVYAHPSDMKGKLTGVGPTTIDRLIERMEEYYEAEGMEMPEPTPKATRAKKTPASTPKPRKKAKKANSDDESASSSGGEGESDDDFKPGSSSKSKKKKAGKGRKSKKSVDSEDGADDSDYRG